jgi:uncharacterized protein YbaA (DUF1428 family)
MGLYVDGFVMAIPRTKTAQYRRIATRAGKIWRQHGALEYRESIGDDVTKKGAVTYPRAVKLKRGEVAWFSWIVYKSRRHRDSVVKKIFKDKRIIDMMESTKGVFDPHRMLYGGFKVLVDL